VSNLRWHTSLRVEDGARVCAIDDHAVFAVLVSGPVLRGMSPTQDLVDRALAGGGPTDPEGVLQALDAYAQGERLVAATAAIWRGDKLRIAWIGDVRGHLIRDAAVVESTRDHTLANELGLYGVQSGLMPDRITTRTLGGPDVRIDAATWTTRPGDTLLLCAPIVHEHRPPSAYVRAALDRSRALDGRVIVES
jgi:hypothetical protein